MTFNRLTSLGLLIVLGLSLTTRADDADALDRELLESLEGTSPADSLERIVPRLIEGTRTAAERLQQGQLDEQTAALQSQILADIDTLLKQSSPPQQPQQNSSSSQSQQDQQSQGDKSQQQQQKDTQQDGQGKQDGQNDPNAASRESEQRTTQGEERDAERERRLGLSTAAWGHLPPKVREQMRSAFSEEYLPEYDALVRRYYEALARRRSRETE